MLLVGLTGNIASGKTEVAHIWAELGAPIVEADQLAREAVKPGSAALTAIVDRWGPEFRLPDGTLNRPALRRIVFADPAELEALNAIVHPEVRRARDLVVADARARGVPILVLDVPLLFEIGMDRQVDRVVLVDAEEEVRIQRLVTLRGLDEDEARRMNASQWPTERKREQSHYIIENNGSIEELQRHAVEVWSKLRNEARAAER